MSTMKKNGFSAIIVLFVLTAIYNTAMFVSPLTHNDKFWWAYGATMLAFVYQLVSALVAFGKAQTLKSKLFGVSVFRVGYIYLVLQLIAGFAFILAPVKVWVSIIVYAVLFGFAVINMIAADTGRKIVQNVENKTKAKVAYIKTIQSDLEALTVKTDNAELRADIKRLADAVKYSDPMSHESLSDLEKEIKEQVEELCDSVVIKDDGTAKSLISEIEKLIVERNQKVKILK